MNLLPTWRYRFFTRLVSPVIFLHLLWRTARDGHWRYLTQRLGFIQPDKQPRIHIHAASVGEVITLLPLIERLQSDDPTRAFLITTNTPTGASILAKRLTGDTVHAYLPIDFAGATHRFFKRSNIRAVWLVETEIWPWLFARAKIRNLPVAIINARLSQKSHGQLATFFEQTYQRALSDVRILARSEEDAIRYKAKGADPDLVSVIGNLKFAATLNAHPPARLLDRPYVLAASTHDDEEMKLAREWLTSSTNHLLVIAPRHVERGARLRKQLHELQQELAADLPPPAQRSNGDTPTEECKLYLADTLGELTSWYAHSEAAFVGGSLIDRGGHNVLEPARLGITIIVGKHTHNFDEEVSLLKSAEGIAISENAEQVVELFVHSLSNHTNATMGTRASEAIRTFSCVLDNYSNALAEVLPVH